MNYYVFVSALLLHQALGDGSSQQVARASNDFANKLYQKVSQKPGNVLVCPLSLHVALALLHQGAGGNTATELAKVLGVNTDSREGYKTILSNIQMQNNILKVATKLYPAMKFQLDRNFVSNAQKYFLSEVEGLNIHNPVEAAGKINKYVEDKTNNKIHNLISPEAITELTRLIIINAVHFQATWKKTFLAAYVDNFKVSPSKSVKTKMMTLTDYFGYKEDQSLAAKVLKMDYEGGDYSMVFVLPNSETGLPALEAKLATTPLENLLGGLYDAKVEVIIPKFKLEQTHNLKDTLASMGLNDMFSNTANLHNISPAGDLHVSDVIQKTFINVHENGTEAAAATELLETLSASTDDAVFFAQRPFHFLLISSKTPKMVLFQGRFVLPQTEDISEDQESINSHTHEKDKTTTDESVNENEKPIVFPETPDINKGSTQPQINPSNTINQPQNPSYGNPQQNPQGNINNPQQNPQGNKYNPQQNPQGNINNPQQKPQGNTYNPQQNPQGNINNPQQNPQGNTYNPQQNPQGNINNPQQNPQGNINNPQQNPQGNTFNQAQNPQGNTPQNPSYGNMVNPTAVNPDRSGFGNPAPTSDNYHTGTNYNYEFSQNHQYYYTHKGPVPHQTQDQHNAMKQQIQQQLERQQQLQQQQQLKQLELQQQHVQESLKLQQQFTQKQLEEYYQRQGYQQPGYQQNNQYSS